MYISFISHIINSFNRDLRHLHQYQAGFFNQHSTERSSHQATTQDLERTNKKALRSNHRIVLKGSTSLLPSHRRVVCNHLRIISNAADTSHRPSSGGERDWRTGVNESTVYEGRAGGGLDAGGEGWWSQEWVRFRLRRERGEKEQRLRVIVGVWVRSGRLRYCTTQRAMQAVDANRWILRHSEVGLLKETQ